MKLGVGYTYANVTFSGGGGVGKAATANLSVLDGYVSGLTIVDAGSGYNLAPTVVIDPPNVAGGIPALVLPRLLLHLVTRIALVVIHSTRTLTGEVVPTMVLLSEQRNSS